MKKFTLTAEKEIKLFKLLQGGIFGFSHRIFLNLLQKKDIKINGKRTKTDVLLAFGDVVEVFLNEEELLAHKPKTLFESDDILVAFKPRRISSEAFFDTLKRGLNQDLLPCHRLDTNTEGLIVYAKNPQICTIITDAFKNGYIEKRYFALVKGYFNVDKTFNAFLTKDKEKSMVKIHSVEVKASEKITTSIKTLSQNDGNSLLEIGLKAGKTHQIRAHLAFLGFPIIGDNKYGDFAYNRLLEKDCQLLTAYKITFKFPTGHALFYLNSTSLEIKPDFLT